MRRYKLSDAEDMFANWAADDVAARFWTWTPHKDISETISYLKQWISEYSDSEYYHWVIESKADNEAVGYIYLNSVNNAEQSAAVHYLICRRLWNNGLMSEACSRVIRFAFEEVGFNRIVSYHHIDNPASGRVMQKCGMTFTGMKYHFSDNDDLKGDYCYYRITNGS